MAYPILNEDHSDSLYEKVRIFDSNHNIIDDFGGGLTYNEAREQAMGTIIAIEVTIASGAALSDAASLVNFDLVGLLMPNVWTAADLTFAVTHEEVAGTFAPLKNADGEVTIPSANLATGAVEYHAVNSQDFLFAQQVKVRSGTSVVPVNQAGARVVTLLLRRL